MAGLFSEVGVFEFQLFLNSYGRPLDQYCTTICEPAQLSYHDPQKAEGNLGTFEYWKSTKVAYWYEELPPFVGAHYFIRKNDA